MADFSKWAMACETAFWAHGTFERAYALNAKNQLDDLIDADPTAILILGFMDSRTHWTGTSSNLLAEINLYDQTTNKAQITLPISPDALGENIERIKPIWRETQIPYWKAQAITPECTKTK